MKVLFITKQCDALDLIYRIQQEPTETYVYIMHDGAKDMGDGIIKNKISNWQDYIDAVDLIVFDTTGFPALVDWLQEKKYNVVGTNKYAELLEINRQYGKKVLDFFNIKEPPSVQFQKPQDVINFIKTHPDRYVLKPNDAPVWATYVAQEPTSKDIIFMLSYCMQKKVINQGLQLQKYVDGVEVGCYGWFDGEDFYEPIELYFEHKKLFPGNVGPMSGEMGSIIIYTDKNNKLYQKTLKKMIPFFKKINYHGCIGLNFIINEDNIWALEFSSRFGYPALYIEDELLDENWSSFLYDIATGKRKEKKFKIKNPIGIGVVLALPPFPFTEGLQKLSIGTPIFFDDADVEHIHFCEIKKSNGLYVSTGVSADPLCVTHNGKTIDEARNNCYAIIKTISIPNMFYRNDIGGYEDLINIEKLKSWGYL
jgi:phosphoribosylamine--glycine ligase